MLKRIPGFEQSGRLAQFVRTIPEGDIIILCGSAVNGTEFAVHPDGVLVKKGKSWYLNGLTKCPPPTDPDQHSPGFKVKMVGRHIGSEVGPLVTFEYEGYEAHPLGVMFLSKDGTVRLITYRHQLTTEPIVEEDPPDFSEEKDFVGGAKM